MRNTMNNTISGTINYRGIVVRCLLFILNFLLENER